MIEYQEFKNQYSEEYRQLTKKYNLVSALRLLVVIVLIYCLYLSFNTGNLVYIVPSVVAFIGFVLLMKIHNNISWNRKIRQQLIAINADEITFLKKEGIPFEDGSEYIDPKHFYSFDLDIFGKHSLYQNLNRTATYIGSKKLSSLLMSLLTNNEIESNQEAIGELSQKITWRQHLLSLAKITRDRKEHYQRLIDWSKTEQQEVPKIIHLLGHLTPFVFVCSFITSFIVANPIYGYLSTITFILNLSLTFSQLKKLKGELVDSDKTHEIIKQYGLIIEQIENESFESKKLNLLKQSYTSELASKQINKLSSLFYALESINNGAAAILLNGAFLYHIRALNNLLNWKKDYSQHVHNWLEIIGEFEALNSLANLSYNNPSFTFPVLNNNYEIEFEKLGHPLIQEEKRVCNNIAFTENNFVILTGSNMSGKSTFLRTLGINMVLASIGAPICSTKANIHPLHVIVSMRQSDSLNDGESYFFAEVKRLKQLMDKLESQRCFVLLDEILKGTNSDDKQTGTIEVIKKIISKDAIGSIATHDLDVCQTTNEYPDKLINKCFEVEIIDNDLSFDYALRDGICKNKSASFLMKKLKVV